MRGFSGDEYLKIQFQEWLDKAKPEFDLIVETGTFKGDTTKQFLDMSYCEVLTIEVHPQYYKEAAHLDTEENKYRLHRKHGNSGKDLYKFVKDLHIDSKLRVIYFLDAHWPKYCPLLDELRQISKLFKDGITKAPYIAIHDFYNPNWETAGLPEIHYDAYNGQPLNWEWVKGEIAELYKGTKYEYSYNEKASGAQRGCLFTYPVSTK